MCIRDRLIASQSGKIKSQIPEISMHFPEDMLLIEKWQIGKPISVIYYDKAKDKYFGKRFLIESLDKDEMFLKEGNKIELVWFSTDWRPVCTLHYAKARGAEVKVPKQIYFENFISPKGIKAIGNQLSSEKLKRIESNDPLPYTPTPPLETVDIETISEEVMPEKDDNKGQITLNL